MGRVAVIGDVGGQLSALEAELIRLGADPDSLRLPADLTVVQVGDLIHRGPDSEGVIGLVDRMLTDQPRQWIQLVGNHEAQYLREPAFHWAERVTDDTADQITTWWFAGQMKAAAVIEAGAGATWLVTHAGLTHGFWEAALGAPATAELAALRTNSFIGRHEPVLFSHGQMLGGGEPNFVAGPVWANADSEVDASWLQASTPMPFNQIHGHSSAVDWRRDIVTSGHPGLVDVDRAQAHTSTRVGERLIVGVDPGHGRGANPRWAALVFERAVVVIL